VKVGDLVKWTELEECYYIACGSLGMKSLTDYRKCGIIVDNNGINFFVRWENGDFKAARPDTIEVISEGRRSSKTQKSQVSRA
tara:strand:+ start:119 stop:367 length:249 start_codon:yes stop_codon:yes gene_type:complete